MSTYLQLCQNVCRECGISGGDSVPTAVTSQSGELDRVVNWVKNAWTEIQNRSQQWRWMRSRFSVNTVADDDTYAYGDCTDTRLSAAISRFARWWITDDQGLPNITAYLNSAGVAGEYYLAPIDWQTFRSVYRRGSQTSSMPIHVSVDPQNNLVIGPAPSAVYVVRGEYQMGPQILAADLDTPEMPSRFHDLIVYRAMERYGQFDTATEVFNRGVYEGNRMLRQLEADQLPEMCLVGPMA